MHSTKMRGQTTEIKMHDLGNRLLPQGTAALQGQQASRFRMQQGVEGSGRDRARKQRNLIHHLEMQNTFRGDFQFLGGYRD